MQLIKMSIYQNKSIAIESASEMSSQRVAFALLIGLRAKRCARAPIKR
jgi:hypothetical protein